MVKLLLLMLFMHIVDDFYLQGKLASMKQKVWWKNKEWSKSIYNHDYKMALLIHSMSWSIMIILVPMILFNLPSYFLMTVFVVNTAIHYYVDDLKANKLKISLVVDQLIHFSQIFITFALICQFI